MNGDEVGVFRNQLTWSRLYEIGYCVIVVPLTDPARYALGKLGDLNAVLDQMLDSGQFVLGDMVAKFESEFATFIGVKHCVAVASGTDALEISLRALGCEGREVLLAANTGGYGTISCLAINAIPVFIDIEHHNLLISTSKIVERVTASTGAVIVTHLFGLALNVAELDEAIQKKVGRSIPIIEDCAQAHGAKVGSQRAGSQGLIGCFSFYPTKNLGALGDGGAIMTNDDLIFRRVSQLRQYGWSEKYLQEVKGGRNSRLDELQAGFLSRFIGDLDERNSKRRLILKKYRDCGASVVHGEFVENERYVAHLAVCTVRDRTELQSNLFEHDIATSIHYPYLDTEFITTKDICTEPLPNSDFAKSRVLTLPCFPEMTLQEVDKVCRSIVKFKSYFENQL